MRTLILFFSLAAFNINTHAQPEEVPGCPVVGIKESREFYRSNERRCFKNAGKARRKGYVEDDDRSGSDGWIFLLNGTEEVPAVTTSASGNCLAVLSTDGATLEVLCTHNISDPTIAHVHIGAIGEEGSPVCNFNSGTSPISATCSLTSDLISSLQNGSLYINVHSITFPDGELRGQVD